jgi:electron transport complex protein RnfE
MRSDLASDAFRWRGHIAPLVGLCPLLALAPDAARALALAVAMVLITLLTLPWWALQHRMPGTARWPTAMLCLAAAAGITQLFLDALNHGLHPLTALGVPLIAVNLRLLLSAGGLAGDDPATPGTGDTLGMLRRAVGAAAALLLLGALRELFAQGTVFASAGEYFGNDFAHWTLRWTATPHGLLLFAQPAGALFALACLLAALQAWRLRQPQSADNA